MPEERENYCILVKDLTKAYRKNEYAIKGVSFGVEYGKVFGFLGPNGAGKSTIIKVLTTVIPPTSGSVFIFGKDIKKSSLQIRRQIGVILQEPSFEANLTVQRSLNLHGLLWGLSAKERKSKTIEILKEFDLVEIKDKKNDELSIGQRRRVQVAREFMHEMDLLFLDEPTVGLDTYARRKLLDRIKDRVRLGLTVFFTTHNMEEAEYLCDKIAIIDRGKIVAHDTPAGLRRKDSNIQYIEIKFKSFIDDVILGKINSIAGLEWKSSSLVKTIDDNTVRMSSSKSQKMVIRILQYLDRNNIEIENISIVPPTLEEAFLDLLRNSRIDN